MLSCAMFEVRGGSAVEDRRLLDSVPSVGLVPSDELQQAEGLIHRRLPHSSVCQVSVFRPPQQQQQNFRWIS